MKEDPLADVDASSQLREHRDAEVVSENEMEAEHPSAGTSHPERLVMGILGALWIIDGILQLQPASFTPSFVNGVLSPNLQGQPGSISAIVAYGMVFFSGQPFLVNLASALLQICLGMALVLPLARSFKVFALYGSIAWSLVVWIFGEGLGNVFTGAASFYSGAPGSVMLYLILALALLHPNRLALIRLPLIAGVIFLFGAALQIFPAFWSAGGVSSIFQLSSSDPIAIISGPGRVLATAGLFAPWLTNLVLVTLLLLFGGLLVFRPRRTIAWVTALFLGLVWWFGQDFGGVQTFPIATATDPNSAPVLMVFLIPLFVGLRPRLDRLPVVTMSRFAWFRRTSRMDVPSGVKWQEGRDKDTATFRNSANRPADERQQI